MRAIPPLRKASHPIAAKHPTVSQSPEQFHFKTALLKQKAAVSVNQRKFTRNRIFRMKANFKTCNISKLIYPNDELSLQKARMSDPYPGCA